MHSHIRAFFLILALTAAPAAAQAWDCDQFEHCCLELGGVWQEAGIPGYQLDVWDRTCVAYRDIPGPEQRQVYCVESWTILSERAHSAYRRGLIGTVPDSCAHVAPSEDDVVEPDDADLPEPGEPDAGE